VTREDVVEFLAVAASIPVETRIEVLPLEEADAVLGRLEAGDISGAAVLQPPTDGGPPP
jgi:propanol-preferring alcohol dehydrogenase